MYLKTNKQTIDNNIKTKTPSPPNAPCIDPLPPSLQQKKEPCCLKKYICSQQSLTLKNIQDLKLYTNISAEYQESHRSLSPLVETVLCEDLTGGLEAILYISFLPECGNLKLKIWATTNKINGLHKCFCMPF